MWSHANVFLLGLPCAAQCLSLARTCPLLEPDIHLCQRHTQCSCVPWHCNGEVHWQYNLIKCCMIESLFFCSGGGIGGGMQFTWAEWPVFLRPSVCAGLFSTSGNVFIVLFCFTSVVYLYIGHCMSWLPNAGIWCICICLPHFPLEVCWHAFDICPLITGVYAYVFVRKLLLFCKPSSISVCDCGFFIFFIIKVIWVLRREHSTRK